MDGRTARTRTSPIICVHPRCKSLFHSENYAKLTAERFIMVNTLFSGVMTAFISEASTMYNHYNVLDRQGRARREAARRRKSEWKVNVAIPDSSRSNGRWQITPKTVSLSIVYHVAYGLASAYSVRALQVGQYARITFLFVGQRSSRVWL